MSASDSGAPPGEGSVNVVHRIRQYRQQYRVRRHAELTREIQRRAGDGERLLGGVWVPAQGFEAVSRRLVRKQIGVCIEVALVIVFVLMCNAFVWRLFGFLFLPHIDRIIP